MDINSDINVIGSILDFSLIDVFLKETPINRNELQQTYTSIKTIKSFKRFESAIKNTLIKFRNKNIEILVLKVIENEGLSFDSLLLLFWNASVNNELLDYLNQKINVYLIMYSVRWGILRL